ncbi:MAG TPA: hypothetical protein QGG59_00730 [Planctomycetota bacterium]|nr:hypothetical protein [Planctomycetota bacterium]MDP6128920.1 hypothetical protein [Planctomycetota bacterium]MDP7245126.1 hypothetical protein [Planctomycetota bacterium]HJM38617.1 hypothetical protein [Planctomycetota bacterium]
MPPAISPALAVFVQILIGLLVSYLARQRGRNPVAWFIAGMLGGVLSLALLVFLPDLERERLWRRLEWMEGQKGPPPSPPSVSEEVVPPTTEPRDSPSPVLPIPFASPLATHGWYLALPGGNPEGPFALDIIREKFKGGELTGFLIWQEALDSWMPVNLSPVASG